MGGRYIVSGVQLGIFKALVSLGDDKEAETLLNQIVQDQHLKYSHEPLKEDVKDIRELCNRK